MNMKQYMIFNINEEEYGVDISDTISIITPIPIARVPKAPNYVKGVINLRGEIIPVMNLREKFGFTPIDETEETRIIIFRVNEAPIGGIVDSVVEVLQLAADSIKGVSELVNNMVPEYVRGIAKVDNRVITLIDLEKLVV